VLFIFKHHHTNPALNHDRITQQKKTSFCVKSHSPAHQVPIILSLQMLELCKFQTKFFCKRGKNITHPNLKPKRDLTINATGHTLITMLSVSAMYNNTTISPRPVFSVQTNINAKRTPTTLYEKLTKWHKSYTFTLTQVLKLALFTQYSLFSSLLHNW
jgi:hypothetical protein